MKIKKEPVSDGVELKAVSMSHAPKRTLPKCWPCLDGNVFSVFFHLNTPTIPICILPGIVYFHPKRGITRHRHIILFCELQTARTGFPGEQWSPKPTTTAAARYCADALYCTVRYCVVADTHIDPFYDRDGT